MREQPLPSAERFSFYVSPENNCVRVGSSAVARRLPRQQHVVVVDDPMAAVWPSVRPHTGRPPQCAGYSLDGVRYSVDGLRKLIAPERVSSRISSRHAAKRRSASSWSARLQDGSTAPRSSPLLSSARRLWTPTPEMRGHPAPQPQHGGFEIRSEVGHLPGNELGRQLSTLPAKPNLRAPAVGGRNSCIERHAFGGGFHNPRASTGQGLRPGATPCSLAPLPMAPLPPRATSGRDELLSFSGEAIAVSLSMPHLPLPAKAVARGTRDTSAAVRWPRAALV